VIIGVKNVVFQDRFVMGVDKETGRKGDKEKGYGGFAARIFSLFPWLLFSLSAPAIAANQSS
jgi:hypothetical protein